MRAALMILLLAVVYMALKAELGGMTFIAVAVVMVAIMFPLFALGRKGKLQDEKGDQKSRDKRLQEELDAQFAPDSTFPSHIGQSSAAEIKQLVADTSPSTKRILFLRPFLLDGIFQVQNPRKDGLAAGIVPFYRFIVPDKVSLDDALRLFLRSRGELVAIGAPSDVVGASRVRVGDSQWQDYFKAMAEGALVMIIFPGLRPGTLWEIENIRVNPDLLAKTVFVLPPEHVETLSPGTPVAETIITALNQRGFRFPEDTKPGEAFLFNADGSIRFRKQLIQTGFLGYWIDKSDIRASVDTVLNRRR